MFIIIQAGMVTFLKLHYFVPLNLIFYTDLFTAIQKKEKKRKCFLYFCKAEGFDGITAGLKFTKL